MYSRKKNTFKDNFKYKDITFFSVGFSSQQFAGSSFQHRLPDEGDTTGRQPQQPQQSSTSARSSGKFEELNWNFNISFRVKVTFLATYFSNYC